MTRVLIGYWRRTIRIPGFLWRRGVLQTATKTRADAALDDDHRRVRDHAVRELARTGAALPPSGIADALGLPRARVVELLESLERRLLYLFRDARGAVLWAYPVTAAETPHRVRFNDEPEPRINAA